MAKRCRRFVKNQFAHVRIAYRTPIQLGLLERFHLTLKQEELYWRLYDHPGHARACRGGGTKPPCKNSLKTWELVILKNRRRPWPGRIRYDGSSTRFLNASLRPLQLKN